jgi:hypothetical protein
MDEPRRLLLAFGKGRRASKFQLVSATNYALGEAMNLKQAGFH